MKKTSHFRLAISQPFLKLQQMLKKRKCSEKIRLHGYSSSFFAQSDGLRVISQNLVYMTEGLFLFGIIFLKWDVAGEINVMGRQGNPLGARISS